MDKGRHSFDRYDPWSDYAERDRLQRKLDAVLKQRATRRLFWERMRFAFSALLILAVVTTAAWFTNKALLNGAATRAQALELKELGL